MAGYVIQGSPWNVKVPESTAANREKGNYDIDCIHTGQ